MGACRWLRERAIVLVTITVILVIAAVVVYIVRAVKPKRVRLRAGVGKITILDFEADGGWPSEPDGGPGCGSDLKALPPTGTDRQ